MRWRKESSIFILHNLGKSSAEPANANACSRNGFPGRFSRWLLQFTTCLHNLPLAHTVCRVIVQLQYFMYFCSTVIVQDWNYQMLQAIRCKAIWTVLYLFITHTVMISEGLSLWQLVLWFWQLLCLCCWWNKLEKLRRHACRVQKCTLDKYTLEKYTLKNTLWKN